MKRFEAIEKAISALKRGRMIILTDDERRENEGDLILAAEKVTPEAINFMTQYGRGLVCMPMAPELVDRLNLPMMNTLNESKHQTPFTVSVGAAKDITTGISAADRAKTVQVAVDPASTREDLVVPGHIFPLRAKVGGVLERAGHTEGGVDFARLAGLQPAAVLCEIMNPDGTMARRRELEQFAVQHNLCMVSIKDLIAYRLHHENIIEEISSSRLPLKQFGEFVVKVYRNKLNGSEQIALIKDFATAAPLVRLHSECLTGDVFGSARCDCGWQLNAGLAKISQEGGVMLYLSQEGRGIGLANKIKAYALQDQGLDTVEANHELGFDADARDYATAAKILKLLGLKKVSLMTNNPRKMNELTDFGVEVAERIAVESKPTAENCRYLDTKKNKLGHLLKELAANERK